MLGDNVKFSDRVGNCRGCTKIFELEVNVKV